MILHAEQGARGKLIDLDTNIEVSGVKSFDVDKGIIEAFVIAKDGSYVRDINGDWLTYTAKGRFKFIPRVDKEVKTIVGADRCVKCSPSLTLPGDDLCPVCRAKERGQRHTMKVERLINPLLDRKCERCSRLAEYAVGDEVTVTPVVTANHPTNILLRRGRGKVVYSRRMTVGRHWYCSFHYQPPRLLDAKGEVIRNEEVKTRPQ